MLGRSKGSKSRMLETSVCDKDGVCLGGMCCTEKGQEGLTSRAIPRLPRFLIDWIG
ncbi:hypothetical protein RO3G_00571 [Rhizopus delemar RA 99-880]|uniref:Uncharacterized protein n=1 Tax=Rhizopus delemar (strain RA 99-880 / ATCC MYA-4621 / FGSC 9543 / NRRL 43880) TaxID=246409 RepID=I1BI37_RHIO9|nr:hypothetical protein RO3G_00571 [Rhizopus delemar RA 99-880]|eukprot:EIE75867.1 hypothetical protein RO3G_00571 [Rhizopus delemar RA 99-880]